MSESANKIRYRRGGSTYDVKLYTSTSDVGADYIKTRMGSQTLYAKLGDVGDTNASHLRVRKGTTTKAILTTAISPIYANYLAGTPLGFYCPSPLTQKVTLEYWAYVTPSGKLKIGSQGPMSYTGFHIVDGNIYISAGANAFAVMGAVPSNAWTHVAFACGDHDTSGQYIYVYANGSLVYTCGPLQYPWTGGWSGFGESGYDGECRMAEFRVWSTQRYASQILSNMNTRISTSSQLKTYYKMNAESQYGSSILDSSDYGNHGSLYPSTWWV